MSYNDDWPAGLMDLDAMADPFSINSQIPLRDGRLVDIVDLTIPELYMGVVPMDLGEKMLVTIEWNDAATNVRLTTTMPLNSLLLAYVQGRYIELDAATIVEIV